MTDAPPELARWRNTALAVGVIGLGVAVVAAISLPFGAAHFFRAWLVGFNLATGAAVGSLVVIMIHYVMGGNWGWVLRPTLEAASRTLPLMAILFIPLAFGMDHVYEWSRYESARASSEDFHHDHELEHKLPYLNRGAYFIRAGIVFAIWSVMAYLLSRWSVAKKDETDAAATLSAPGILVYVITVSFAAIDWGMSLEPRWYSTIYPAMFGMGQVMTGFAVCVAVFLLLAKRDDLARAIDGQNMADLGSVMGAFILIWAYLSFMQFLIIWMGHIPEELPWYFYRMREGPWLWVVIAVLMFHVAVPFALLMNVDLKRNRLQLAGVALLVLAMRPVELLWLLVPAFNYVTGGVEPGAFSAFVLYPAAIAGIGGLWFAAFCWQLASRPLLPIHPLPEDASHGQASSH